MQSAPTHKFPLSTLCALRGADGLGATAKAHPRAICAKFNSPADYAPELDTSSALYQQQHSDGIWIAFDMPDDRCKPHVIL